MQTAVITGASKGIGRAIAELFAKKGFNVVICYNSSAEDALSLENELRNSSCSVASFKADVKSTEDIKALFEFAYDKFGSIDVLINNAGVSQIKLLNDMTDDDINNLNGTNFIGSVKCVREAIPYMLKNHSGAIVNVSSMWGITGASCESVYSGTKGALISFTKAIAKELGPSGIRVNCVAPGVIDTDMNKDLSNETMVELCQSTPLGRIGKPSDVAEAVYFLCSDRASFITGQTLSVDGGFCV